MCKKCYFGIESSRLDRQLSWGTPGVRMEFQPWFRNHDLRWAQQEVRLTSFDRKINMTYFNKEEGPDVHEFDPEASYTNRDLEMMADQLLRENAGMYDEADEGGKGIKARNPILFAEHIRTRQAREIVNKTGVPEPGIARGIYNRQHPEGRKVNSEEARKKHGASYYR